MKLDAIHGYHAHVYFEPETRGEAERLRARMEAEFPDGLYGRWHDRPVGPHPSAMFQVAFDKPLFATLVPWLALNHGLLTVFLHPETGDDLADHAEHAIWIGRQQTLKLEQFMRAP
ncbi:MAG: DOPA 4,5-dioxygenase family protein [Beijerinckiaceae bacterium]|nr:DOPA 4,5-dioxygenase family protein [Beijerinckiaceae bacterium]